MADLGRTFDSDQFEDMGDFSPVPAGDYLCKVVDSEFKDNSKGTGKLIKFEFDIMQGEYKGKKFWTNLNIVNQNNTAVEIAQKELATICRACGKGPIKDTQEVHGIPMMVKLKISPAKDGYDAKNVPTGYFVAAGSGATNPSAGYIDTPAGTVGTPPEADTGWDE